MTGRSNGLHRPGELVRGYAQLRGWPISQYNLMVEGEHDQAYFQLASELHSSISGKSLVGKQLAVFPPGTGNAGGTFGIQNDFPTLRNLADVDLSPDGNRLFIVVALLDSDPAGKQALNALTARHTRFEAGRDVFLLQRVFPRIRGDAVALMRAIEQANHPWKKLDCEIEDLISDDLIDTFCDEDPKLAPRKRRSENGRRHLDFEAHVKAKLVRFVRDNAITSDLVAIIEVLKSLRLYVGLDPEGDPL